MAKYTKRSYDQTAVAAQDSTFAVAGTGVAAAANAVTIVHDSATFIYVTGFIVTTGHPSSNLIGTVTLAGLTTQDGGGTLSFILEESSTVGGILNVTFPNPIPAASITTDVVLTVPAIASGAATAAVLCGYRRPE